MPGTPPGQHETGWGGSGVMAGCEAGFYDGVLRPVKNKQIRAREGGNIPRKKLLRLKGKKIL